MEQCADKCQGEGTLARQPAHANYRTRRKRRGDQTIMDIAGHVSKQMLKHHSHIRMEAKRSALEAIVDRRPADVGPSQEEQAAKSPDGLQNGRKRVRRDRTEAKNEDTSEADNSKNLCSETPTDTQHFDGEYPQKSPQSDVFEVDRGVEKLCKSMNLIGGRGRNRTYNLSVKSRAICSRSCCYRLL